MTAVTNQYSLESPVLNSTSIDEVQEFNSHLLNRRIQLVAITALLGGACALSAAGILPATVLVSCAVSATGLIVVATISTVTHSIFRCTSNTPVQERNEFEQLILNLPPYLTCVLVPAIEEVVFRTLVQGGLYAALSYVLPATAVIAVVGLEFPLAAVVSIVATGVIFGLAHGSNHRDDPFARISQVALTSIGSIFVEGPLYYAFGLWASTVAHITHNTLSLGTYEAVLSCQQVNSTDS